MSRTSILARLSNALLASPVIWGGLACLGFYAVLGQGTLKNPLVGRYFESHPVEYITTALFFIGLAALVMKALDVIFQNMNLGRRLLEDIPAGGQSTDDAQRILERLENTPLPFQRGYRFDRLYQAIEFIRRKGTADSLDNQLRFLADEDYGRMQTSYAFVRIIIWAIPILGFLGTVIGITLAIGKLSPQQLEQSLPAVMAGLSVAFDTTALALSLSILLMFAKFFVEQIETGLLVQVDARINEELVGRFQQVGTAHDPNSALVQRSINALVKATESLTIRQAEIWKETIDDAHERWMSLTTMAGEVVENALAEAVAASIERHAGVLENGLEHHATELLDGMARQATAITDCTQELSTTVAQCMDQLQASTQASSDQFSASIADNSKFLARTLAESSTEHATLLTTSLQEMTTVLNQVVADHRDSLASGTDRLLQSVAEGLAEHREAILAGEQSLAEENRRHWNEVQLALVEAAAQAVDQQEQLVRQGEVLLKVVDATGQVQRLEDVLNENLAALANAHYFEQTVTGLAAAVQLLTMKLDPLRASDTRVQLDATETQPPMAA